MPKLNTIHTTYHTELLSKVAATQRSSHARTGLTAALRALPPNRTLFVPVTAGNWQSLQANASGLARNVALRTNRTAHTRVDRDAGGIWVWFTDDSVLS